MQSTCVSFSIATIELNRTCLYKKLKVDIPERSCNLHCIILPYNIQNINLSVRGEYIH